MNRLLPLSLAILIAITAQAFGAAHGMRWTGDTMEICRGSGVAVVPVPGDTDGRVHLCPDAAVALFTDTAAAPDARFAPVGAGWRVLIAPDVATAPTLVTPERARSPPVS